MKDFIINKKLTNSFNTMKDNLFPLQIIKQLNSGLVKM